MCLFNDTLLLFLHAPARSVYGVREGEREREMEGRRETERDRGRWEGRRE